MVNTKILSPFNNHTETITERFVVFMHQQARTPEEIVKFFRDLDKELEAIINSDGQLNENVYKELHDFLMSIGGIMLTIPEIKAAFGNEGPLSLRLLMPYLEEKAEREHLANWNQLSDVERKEVETLTDMIFQMKGQKKITFALHEETNETLEFNVFEASGNASDDKKRKELLRFLTNIIRDRKTIVVQCVKNGRVDVFGFDVNSNGEWSPISRTRLINQLPVRNNLTHRQKKHVSYVEIQRN